MPNFCQPDIKSTHKILIFPLIEYVNFWLKITLFWPTKKKQLPNWINAGLSKPEGGGWWGCQIFTDQLTLSQPRGTDNAHQIITGTPVFLGLPTAPLMLLCITEVIQNPAMINTCLEIKQKCTIFGDFIIRRYVITNHMLIKLNSSKTSRLRLKVWAMSIAVSIFIYIFAFPYAIKNFNYIKELTTYNRYRLNH